ncbi:MAG TPA: PASTA domain-containing protein [Acidobacteriaceae bacterium]|nr:PASTA domain-containing protein [Acidobacteriaceae bacterium]
MIGFFRFLLVILLLTVVAMTSAIVTMHFAIHGAEVSVPDFRGLTLSDAGQRAARAGLTLHVENHLYSTDVPAGRIANQSPPAGTIVRGGWRVWLTQSLGPRKIAIPDVTGKEQRLASLEIRRAGLQVGSIAILPQPGAQAGTVIAQSPAADASGVASPVVNLLVAGPQAAAPAAPQFVMPDVIGQTYSAASQSLTRAGLMVAPAVVQPPVVGAPGVNPTSPPPLSGTIVAQNPPAGYPVDPTTTIQLTVAQ